VAATMNPSETTSKPSETLQDLLKRARKGDACALEKILEFPECLDALGGNLAQQAEASFVKAAAGDDIGRMGALTRKMELLRAELAGSKPTPIERLLVERVVACWLQVQDADIRYAQARDLSLKWYEYYQRRMSYSHKRYLSALKTLALVRKLAVPVLQVNIAKKQTNIAGPVIGKEGNSVE
jgi:hypothetical protein